jgi:hypothetical protein
MTGRKSPAALRPAIYTAVTTITSFRGCAAVQFLRERKRSVSSVLYQLRGPGDKRVLFPDRSLSYHHAGTRSAICGSACSSLATGAVEAPRSLV